MLLYIVYINHPNQAKRSVPKCRRIYVLPPPPPKNRDKSKNPRSVKTALRASTLSALGFLIALAVLLPNAAAEAQTSPASTATATATPTDYDSDNDGLIDINNLAQLNAVRYDLNGDGKQGSVSTTDWATYTSAFPNPASGMGCKPTDHDDDTTTAQQPTCDGYELMTDLDFDTDGDGDVDSSDTYPNWTPIGTAANKFDSTFKGRHQSRVMPKISNLTITSSSSTEVGLFGATSSDAHIEDIGLVDVNVSVTASALGAKIGALVGSNAGKVIACYSTGKISADAGAYPYAGGLVAFNTGTIAAAFSRATVNMSSTSEIYVGGLTGYNNGTITATYSAGAVKGKGNINSRVGGLVGQNDETITASYSIAPVTAAATGIPGNTGGGLVGYNDRTKGGAITASYWDYIASGVPDDADDVAPEGWHTADFVNEMNVSPPGWATLTIDTDDPNDDTAWEFSSDSSNWWYPRLTYGGHTVDRAGNQQLATLEAANAANWWSVKERISLPGEGMIFRAGGVRGLAGNPVQATTGVWMWESSVDGIDWTTLSPLPGKDGGALRAIGGNSSNTHLFIPRSEHVGKYIRAKIRQSGSSDYLVSGAIKIKAATTATTPALRFASGNPPLVGRAIAIAIPSSLYGAVALWYSCDANTANPPGTGCELVGSRSSYTPGGSDYGRYLYAHIYHANGNTWSRANTGFTQSVSVGAHRTSQWRTTE